jgi:hypothetical protein
MGRYRKSQSGDDVGLQKAFVRVDHSFVRSNVAVDLHGHSIDVSSMAALFPMMMHTHLVAYRVMMVVIGVCRRDGGKQRNGSHGSKNDLFHICEVQFVDEDSACALPSLR